MQAILVWILAFAKAIFLDIYQAAFKFLSRKLFFCIFSVVAIIYSIAEAKKVGLSDQILVWTLPVVIISITMICVTYMTGMAKIELQAKVEGPK